MKGSSYRDRDYAFGQAMQTLRTAIGLTQAGLAKHLGVSRKAVGEWEAGLTYPKAEHLKVFIALAVEQQAFPLRREEEEIRTFWHAARQKVLLDEAWLGTLLPHTEVSPVSQPVEETIGTTSVLAPLARGGPRVDWGDAPTVTTFFGREWEQTLLTSWIFEERCRVVSVLGLGGIGKSALATRVMHRVAEHFEVVIWRSLRDAPTCEALLEECLQSLAPQALRDVSGGLERRLGLLLEYLRNMRVLLVLDNLETLLEEGEGTGHMRAGYEGYARLLRRMAETEHQSCLLLTSREKPSDLVPLEGSRAPVRALRLARLDVDACKQLLAEKEVAGSAADQAQLIEAYTGNPLALKIVAQTIVDLFDGQIALFLEQGKVVFGGVRELLDQQYARLADLERTLLCWLAIIREPVSIEELHALLVVPSPAGEVLEAVDGLHRRSLIERGQRPGSFALQSVVLEYVTMRLIAEASREVEQGRLVRLVEHGLVQAHAKDYVRQAQERLIVAPLLARLQNAALRPASVEEVLQSLLDQLRRRAQESQGYGPANLVALLREQRGHLRSLDLSQLAIRGAFLQGVEMQDASLAEASLRETVFNEAFDIPWPGRRILTRCEPSPSAWMDARWLLGAGMVPSSYGTSRAVPCSGQAGSRRTSSAWPLPPMDAQSPAAEMMPPSSSGTPTRARTSRRSPASAARCSPWPGVPMGTCLRVGALMGTFDCGSYRERSQKPLCGCSRDIPTGCWDWLLLPMAAPWPARVGTGLSSCGMWGRREADVYSRRSQDIQTGCGRWPGARMGTC